MRAILSDIHGNLEALQAVLSDARCHGVSEIFCLGDLVGYGPHPLECVALSMAWNVVLQGNFDYATIIDVDLSLWTAHHAAKSVLWCRELLKTSADGSSFRQFMAERPLIHTENECVFVHGTPRNCLHEFLYPEDIYNTAKLSRIANTFHRYCFNGTTHIPGIFVEEQSELWKFFSPTDCDYSYRLDGRKTICNVGSVGQPHDGDWRACYVLVDGEFIRFRRISYDVQATANKIYGNPYLDHWLGVRLTEGR